MTTVEREPAVHPGPAPSQPVFSSDNNRRERVLRIVGRLGAVLAGIWLLALLAGAMGFGSLPLIPGSGLLDRSSKPSAKNPRKPAAAGANSRSRFAARTVSSTRSGAGARQAAAARRRALARRKSLVAPRPTPPAGQVVPPAAPPLSPGKPRGQAVRAHGNPVHPPPPAAQGQAKGQEVVNPGRLKHLLPPPPPPPPPSKKP
ncbi:MAG: hypothetical protein ABI896_03845 [Actinomycetota bacterium]